MSEVPALNAADSNTSLIRLLLVDDEPTVRTGWKLRFGLEADLVIVGEAGDGQEALELVAQLIPDVILLDVDMPVMDGISAAREIKSIAPDCFIIVVTIDDNMRVRSSALEAGAAALIGKHEPFENLLKAIRSYGHSQTDE